MIYYAPAFAQVPRKKRLQNTGYKGALPWRNELVRFSNIHGGSVSNQAVSDMSLHGIYVVKIIINETNDLVELIRFPSSSTEAMASSRHPVEELEREEVFMAQTIINCFRNKLAQLAFGATFPHAEVGIQGSETSRCVRERT